MKSHFIALLLLVFIAMSCKKETAQKTTSAYPAIVVGTVHGTNYSVANEPVLKQEWEKQLRAAGITSKIQSFKIGVLKVDGDGHTVGPVIYFGLTAVTKDGKASMCARVDLKANNFYFNEDTPAIICSGTCPHGCNPSGVSKNGTFFLICSECADCVKTDFVLNFQ